MPQAVMPENPIWVCVMIFLFKLSFLEEYKRNRKALMQYEEKVEFREVKVFINPKFSLPSAETWKESEGCLSIPTIHGM